MTGWMPKVARAEPLAAPGFGGAAIAHGFFTRRGGVSRGVFAELNVGLGSGDDPAHVRENRARAMAALGARALYTPYQVHGSHVVILREAAMARRKADAVVTSLPGVAVGVVTADCVPVLFAAPRQGIVGAAHAGWRGAVAGVVEATLAAFGGLGAPPQEIMAAVGPAIQQPSYEVGEDVKAAVCRRLPQAAGLFRRSKRQGRYLFDLPGFVALLLARAGVRTQLRLARDTYREAEVFFSYRRSRHLGEPAYGRQLSAVMLKG